jgi:hypothetical protein
MKTNKILVLSFALFPAFYACEKVADENKEINPGTSVPAVMKSDQDKGMCFIWVDNFDTPRLLKEHWKLYGDPLPRWQESAYGRNGLFDNNGPSPTKNYAFSDTLIGRGYGYIVESEVMLKITNPQGACVCPGIALTKHENPIQINNDVPTGISMRIIYAGASAIWFPAKMRNHTWCLMNFISANETVVSSGYIPADKYSNNWYILRFEVSPEGYVKFFCDETLLWAPLIRIHPMMESDNRVLLGYTSDGNRETCAGVAYHNWVKATFSLSPKE